MVHKERVQVKGSWSIHRIDYDDNETLIVYMQDGSKLEYASVPRHVFNDFQKAESKGKFFNANVRNKYQYLG